MLLVYVSSIRNGDKKTYMYYLYHWSLRSIILTYITDKHMVITRILFLLFKCHFSCFLSGIAGAIISDFPLYNVQFNPRRKIILKDINIST